MQVYSMPELMKLVYEFDATYHVPYEKCLAELPQALEDHKRLCLGRKLLDTYMMKDMEELGYKFVKVVSCETDELETSGLGMGDDDDQDDDDASGLGMWDDDDQDDDDDHDHDDDTSTSTSSDTSVLSALRLEASFYTREVTVTCQFQLPDSDVVKMFEAYFEAVEYDHDDKSLTCHFLNLREKPVYAEDMDE